MQLPLSASCYYDMGNKKKEIREIRNCLGPCHQMMGLLLQTGESDIEAPRGKLTTPDIVKMALITAGKPPEDQEVQKLACEVHYVVLQISTLHQVHPKKFEVQSSA